MENVSDEWNQNIQKRHYKNVIKKVKKWELTVFALTFELCTCIRQIQTKKKEREKDEKKDERRQQTEEYTQEKEQKENGIKNQISR